MVAVYISTLAMSKWLLLTFEPLQNQKLFYILYLPFYISTSNTRALVKITRCPRPPTVQTSDTLLDLRPFRDKVHWTSAVQRLSGVCSFVPGFEKRPTAQIRSSDMPSHAACNISLHEWCLNWIDASQCSV